MPISLRIAAIRFKFARACIATEVRTVVQLHSALHTLPVLSPRAAVEAVLLFFTRSRASTSSVKACALNASFEFSARMSWYDLLLSLRSCHSYMPYLQLLLRGLDRSRCPSILRVECLCKELVSRGGFLRLYLRLISSASEDALHVSRNSH
jgi:hypothetical protein